MRRTCGSGRCERGNLCAEQIENDEAQKGQGDQRRLNRNLVETQNLADHPQNPREQGHPGDRQRKNNYQRENIIHGLPPLKAVLF